MKPLRQLRKIAVTILLVHEYYLQAQLIYLRISKQFGGGLTIGKSHSEQNDSHICQQ